MITMQTASPAASSQDALPLCCWCCGDSLNSLVSSYLCTKCGTVTLQQEGIWRAFSPSQERALSGFIAEYEFIREAEGRGSDDAAYYLALPYYDITGKLSAQWKIRAATYSYLSRRILSRLAKDRPLRILDLGAGNGWLSYRLSLLGHRPVAVDILTNDRDGLGAAVHYATRLPSMFQRVQASLSCLPFPRDAFDLAIFNASFHYSEDYIKTFSEALRCTCPGGAIVIADTPWYRDESSGEAMVEEKHAHFRATYGFASDSLASQEFVTPLRLDAIANAFGIHWNSLKPFYGIQWALRPLGAQLKGRRKPSEFRIFVAEVPA